MITKGIANNSYDVISVYNGVLAYSDQDVLKAIVVEKDYSSDGYAQKFYYDNGNLIFQSMKMMICTNFTMMVNN